MKSNSSLNPPYFQFTLFADFGPLRYLFFILCLFIYVTIVSANMVIILAVFLEKSLHQPMYIFISCLCLNSLYGSAGFFPEYLIIPPLNNPIVYGLGLPQIKGVILRFLKKDPTAEI
ncbi:Olfactory receptor 1P1 [Dissostichus eleginoides]|uniref:Olfactory receptor 1P1 n=1 Tax=Dissostichus eleginoides TaxID=100907 RepID=A0AAD9CLT2_DISEL|nr:Olfactory receptor 1P1 [Dissostichus eleginoides]